MVEAGALTALDKAAEDNGDNASVDTERDAEHIYEPTINEIEQLATRILALAVDLENFVCHK